MARITIRLGNFIGIIFSLLSCALLFVWVNDGNPRAFCLMILTLIFAIFCFIITNND